MTEKIIWSATPTPFLEDGSLDRESIAGLVEHHVAMGVGGLFVGGTCGEGPFMPNGRRAELVALMKQAAGDRLHISAQVTDTSASRVIDNAKQIADSGVDSMVIAPPWVVAPFHTDAFLRRYFFEPMEAISVPVGIYIRPPVADSALDIGLWKEIVSHPAVSLIKDSSSSVEYREAFVSVKRADVTTLTGDEFDVMAAAAAGYDGCLMGTGILNAKLIRKGFEALAAGSREEADKWQERSNEFLLDMFRQDRTAWLAGLKYALCRLGIFSCAYSNLTFSIDDEDKKRIDEALERESEFLA